jgi:hypothetical protein
MSTGIEGLFNSMFKKHCKIDLIKSLKSKRRRVCQKKKQKTFKFVAANRIGAKNSIQLIMIESKILKFGLIFTIGYNMET